MRLSSRFPSLEVYEDDEQARIVSHPPVLLYYDPDTEHVLRGPYVGLNIDIALIDLLIDAIVARCAISETNLRGRPWWRWFRATPAVRVSFLPLQVAL